MMRENLPCSVVRDLLPTYVEHLTDEETERLVKNHLQSCRDCAAIYRDMTGAEPVVIEEQAEVDYLKKVHRSRRRLTVAAALLTLLLAGVGIFLLLRPKTKTRQILQAAMPEWTYDEETKTLVVYGTEDYTRLELPDTVNQAVNLEVQDDSFHLSVYLPVLRNEAEPLQTYIPGFLDRTDKSLSFLRSYLKEQAGEGYQAENGEKFVELSIRRKGNYEYSMDEDRLMLEVGDYYWLRDTVYLLSLLDFKDVQWQQLGYVFYLAGTDPYGELLAKGTIITEDLPYYEAYMALGGPSEDEAENYLRLHQAIAWYCIHKGTGHWGTPFESHPVTDFAWYTGPKKAVAGNDMSPAMATAFIAWLTEEYGFEAVSDFCLGQSTFREAFGTDLTAARNAWTAWLDAAVES